MDESQQMNRRRFLKAAGVGTAVLGVGGLLWRVGGVWWRQPAGQALKVLSDEEVRIVGAIAQAFFPGDPNSKPPLPSGMDVGLINFFDELLATGLDEQTADLVRLVLHLIDDASVVSDLGMTRFHRRPLEERIEILRAWETSSLVVRRGAVDSVKIFMSMGYCEHPSVLDALGIEFTCGGAA